MSLGECVSWREFDIFPFCFVLFNGLPHPPPTLLKQSTHLIYIVIPLA
jgi:hypothetical protein